MSYKKKKPFQLEQSCSMRTCGQTETNMTQLIATLLVFVIAPRSVAEIFLIRFPTCCINSMFLLLVFSQ